MMAQDKPDDKEDLLQGTLDMLILKTVALGPVHGWGISQRIRQISSEVLQVHQGSLYPALIRLERQGLISASWGVSENNRRAKFYELTPDGHRRLEMETASWDRLAAAVYRVLQAT
jgi:PadR family transcriptional regulator PadR